MSGTIIIEYELLKEAIERVEKKRGECKRLPSVRFCWKSERHIPEIQVGNRLPELGGSDMNCGIVIDTLICDRIGWESTGDQADTCKNCLIEKVKK